MAGQAARRSAVASALSAFAGWVAGSEPAEGVGSARPAAAVEARPAAAEAVEPAAAEGVASGEVRIAADRAAVRVGRPASQAGKPAAALAGDHRARSPGRRGCRPSAPEHRR